jgi:hypothetical protein
MTESIFLSLVYNTALLLLLANILDIAAGRLTIGRASMVQVPVGIALGVVGIIIMYTHLDLDGGAIFDTRSILLGISGLFFGTLSTATAIVITSVFRYLQGGSGVLPGILVIVATGTAGLLWRHQYKKPIEEYSWKDYYIFGVAIHCVMILLMLTFPWDIAMRVLRTVSIPVIVIYPVGTALVGSLLGYRLQRQQLMKSLRENETKFRIIAEHTSDWEYWVSPEHKFLYNSPSCEQLTGYTPAEFLNDTALLRKIIYPDDAEIFASHRHHADGQKSGELEFRIVCKDGAVRWIGHVCVPVFDEQGRFLGTRGSNRDIGGQKIAEQNSFATQQEIQKLLSITEESRRSLLSVVEDQNISKREITQLNERLHTLVDAVKNLASAHTLDDIQRIVSTSARKLTGADGATIVLRDGTQCYYADEDAIQPLWKGKRFPMTACISGWVMMNKQHAVIGDIYADERVPIDAYRPTFVKSLAMIPINTVEPLGAIGNYWQEYHVATDMELRLLQTLSDAAARTIENVRLYDQLEERVEQRTLELKLANKELEAFSYSVSHDLRAPLRGIDGWSLALLEDNAPQLDEQGKLYIATIRDETQRMGELIDDLLQLSRVARAEIQARQVDLSSLSRRIVERLNHEILPRKTTVIVQPDLSVYCDPNLMDIVLTNLIGNAVKFTGKTPDPVIEFGQSTVNGEKTFFIRDNGAGFDMTYAGKLFGAFQRMHKGSEFPGTGVGLAIVQRIIHRHGGRIWAEAEVNRGAVFYFTLKEHP